MSDPWMQAFLVESKVAVIMAKQAHRGVYINKVKAGFYVHVLTEKVLYLDRLAVPQMPEMMVKGCTATEPYTKGGVLKANVRNWLEKTGYEMEIDGPFCGVEWAPFDMGKTEEVKEFLAGKLGWVPDTWKYRDITMHTQLKRPLSRDEQKATLDKYMLALKNTHLGALRLRLLGIKPGTMTKRQVQELILKKRKVPAGAKLTEESLDKIKGGGLGMLLKQRLTYAHRLGLIRGLIKLVRADGRIPAEANPIGTPTMRMRHKKVVNVPKAARYVLFGAQCRSVFESTPLDDGYKTRGFVFRHHLEKPLVIFTNVDTKGNVHKTWVPANCRILVGYDGAGLELRMLAHYVNDPEYTKQILDGDIHSYNQQLAGLPNRDAAKTFIYAFLYGAGDQKIGDIIEGTREDGKAIKDRFFDSLPMLKELIDRVKEDGEKGYLIGLDGRKLWLRKDGRGRPMTHKALNLLLQAAGAVVMKYAMVLLDEAIEAEGLDAWKVIDMHDEGQYDIHPRDYARVMQLMDICVMKAGELLGMNLPLASDSVAGHNWKETH